MAGTAITIPYKPRELMESFHETQKRWRVLILHRRFGKTVAAINHLIKQANTPPEVLAKARGLKYDKMKLIEWEHTPRLFAYIAPFYTQAKSIAWDMLKYYSAPIPGIVINESELRIDYPGKGRIRLFGNDNPQSHRGLRFWECVLDEFQDHNPFSWEEVILPACFDTQAPITFIGTIKGKDHLYRAWFDHKDNPEWFSVYLPASKSGVLDETFLAKEREIMSEAKFMQEYELEPYASIEGAIFGKEMAWLRAQNRITPLIHEELADVDTYWDLGISDYLVVLFFQRVGSEHRIIDCYFTHNTNLAEVAKVMAAKPYFYGTHYLPHDAKQREQTSGMSREDFLKDKLKGTIAVVPRVKQKEDAVQAVRFHYKKLWIHAELETLTEALSHYSMEFDEERRVWKNIPKHDWTSHFSDALMGWAVMETTRVRLETVPTFSHYTTGTYTPPDDTIHQI
jgi:phage terminase large subunit